jgi:hypothetical protein
MPEAKPRKVRITFTAVVTPWDDGKRFTQKDIKQEVSDSFVGGSITNIKSFQVEELEER